MLKLPIPWPPVCHLCGQSVLNFDTAVVVLSDDVALPEMERAKFAVHAFCATDEYPLSVELRHYAGLVHRADRKNRSQ